MTINSKLVRKYEYNGYTIYQGKSAIGNDYLSTELTEEGDMWFHAKDVPGSHLVIKNNGEDFSVEVIKYAVLLTAEKSKIKGNGVVTMVDGKCVNKQNNSKEGTVLVNHSNAKYFKVIV
jgi:predicted ribosome quality control (RQC) complex YloA/Tae2 family protein